MTNNTWQKYRIADLIERGDLIIGDGYRAKNDELGKPGLPFARAGNINGGFQFVDADCLHQSNVPKAREKVSQPGDVVFTSKGTVGRFAFVSTETPQFVYSPQLCYWRSQNEKLIVPRYLFYWMHGREFLLQSNGVKGQTDMADYVSLTDQRRMHITLPPSEEQQAIARILGSLDDKIELNRRMNETLEATTRALFKSWFVDFDPVYARAESQQPTGIGAETAALFPDRFDESALGPIPHGWEIKPLDEIANFLNGLALQKFPPDVFGSLPIIKIAELRRGITESSGRASAGIDARYIVHDGDVLFSWSGSLEARVWCGGDGALNQHLFKVTSEHFPKWFYCLWVRHHLPEFQAIASGKATTMGHIQRHHLTQASVLVPPSALLGKMGEVVEPLLQRQVLNQLEMRTLTHIRDTLLPRLLSGEVRVHEADKTAEVALA